MTVLYLVVVADFKRFLQVRCAERELLLAQAQIAAAVSQRYFCLACSSNAKNIADDAKAEVIRGAGMLWCTSVAKPTSRQAQNSATATLARDAGVASPPTKPEKSMTGMPVEVPNDAEPRTRAGGRPRVEATTHLLGRGNFAGHASGVIGCGGSGGGAGCSCGLTNGLRRHAKYAPCVHGWVCCLDACAAVRRSSGCWAFRSTCVAQRLSRRPGATLFRRQPPPPPPKTPRPADICVVRSEWHAVSGGQHDAPAECTACVFAHAPVRGSFFQGCAPFQCPLLF